MRVVSGRLLLFSALGAYIATLYLALGWGLAGVLGLTGRGRLVVSVAATAVVAMSFQSVRDALEPRLRRLVGDERVPAAEALAAFVQRASETLSTAEVLPEMARVAAAALGARRVEVWLRLGDVLRRAAAWPGLSDLTGELPVDGDTATVPGADRVVEVRHSGEMLGALAVTLPSGGAVTPAEEELLAGLASQAGLVLRNARLTEELRQRVRDVERTEEELRRSRERVVAAQDSERRRLERDIHDGAQQQLVGVAVKVRLARALIERDVSSAPALLEELRGVAAGALRDLQGLAAGIHPARLVESGLAAALREHAEMAGLDCRVEADGLGRCPTDVEAAVYFACAEALQNVAKHANGARATVTIDRRDGVVAFTVADEGPGFDTALRPAGVGLRNLRERLEALGGSVIVRSSPGRGTVVSGTIPESSS